MHSTFVTKNQFYSLYCKCVSPLTPVKQAQALEEEVVEDVPEVEGVEDEEEGMKKPKSWKDVKSSKNIKKLPQKQDKGNFYKKLNKSK